MNEGKHNLVVNGKPMRNKPRGRAETPQMGHCDHGNPLSGSCGLCGRKSGDELLTGAKPSADARLAADVAGANDMRLPWKRQTCNYNTRYSVVLDCDGASITASISHDLARFIVNQCNAALTTAKENA